MSSRDKQPDMTAPGGLKRLKESGDEVGRMLLRTAEYDVPRGELKQDVLLAALAALDESSVTSHGVAEARAVPRSMDEDVRSKRLRVWWLAAAAVGLGAGVFAWLAFDDRGFSADREGATVAGGVNTDQSGVAAVGAPPSPRVLPPCPRVIVAQGGVSLIDDFEDGNARMLVQDGRAGTWGANGDETGKQVPAAGAVAFPVALPEARGESRFGQHFYGERLTERGATLRAEFASRNCYDASVYRGVEFWAKGKGRIYVGLMMIDMMEKRWGGLCERDCYDQHMAPVDLSPEWTRHVVEWDALEQVGYGPSLDFDPRRLLSIEFNVQVPDTPFDVWIDDVGFLKTSKGSE